MQRMIMSRDHHDEIGQRGDEDDHDDSTREATELKARSREHPVDAVCDHVQRPS
jgi:hypothetical protein